MIVALSFKDSKRERRRHLIFQETRHLHTHTVAKRFLLFFLPMRHCRVFFFLFFRLSETYVVSPFGNIIGCYSFVSSSSCLSGEVRTHLRHPSSIRKRRIIESFICAVTKPTKLWLLRVHWIRRRLCKRPTVKCRRALRFDWLPATLKERNSIWL